MKYYIIIPLLFLLLVGCSKKNSNPVETTPPTPVITFTKAFSVSDADLGRSVRQTSDSGYIITGFTSGFGSGFGNGGSVYLIKTDALGNKVWDKAFGSSNLDDGNSIQQTSDGGFIIAGYTYSDLSRSYDIYLIKADLNGNIIWEKTFGGTNEDRGYYVQETSGGGFFIVGSIDSTIAGNNDVYLIRTDASGDKIWEKIYRESGVEFGYSGQQTTDGGFIVSGTKLTPTNNFDVYLIKTDAEGNKVWEKTLGGNTTDGARSIQQTVDGGFIVVGETWSSGAGGSDVYVIKADALGNKVWEKTFGGSKNDWAYSIQQTSDGGFVFVGYTNSFNVAQDDVYLVKTDAGGNKKWEKTFGGTGHDWGYSVQQTYDGGFIITGSTDSYSNGTCVLLIKTDSEGNVK
jgi:hypothetical protein